MSRRRRWLLIAAVTLAVPVVLAGVGWWALATNQPSRFLEQHLLTSLGLPGALTIGRFEVVSTTQVVLHDVSLAASSGAPPAATAKRVVATGKLWAGQVEEISFAGARLQLDAGRVRFLRDVILAGAVGQGNGQPRPLRVRIDGEVTLDGTPALTGVQVVFIATGPAVSGKGVGRFGAEPIAVDFDSEGTGEELRYRIAWRQGKVLPASLCQQLAALGLVSPVPEGAKRWLPSLIDAAGSVVVMDGHAEHFTGSLRAVWAGEAGQLTAAMILDRQHLKLDQLRLRDEGAGQLEGSLTVTFAEPNIEVNALRWHPGPAIPMPAQVPTEAILAVLPQAILRTRPEAEVWGLTVQLSGNGQALLAWAPGKPFTIDGTNLPLTLLQPFLPVEVTLAAGTASHLHVVIEADALDFSAEVGQTRVLWRGWALGAVDGKVVAKANADGFDVIATLPMGRVHYLGAAAAGTLVVELSTVEALLARLKGPSPLPDLRGAISFQVDLKHEGEDLIGLLREARIGDITLPDLIKEFDSVLSGDFTWNAKGVEARLLGQVRRGTVRLPGSTLPLATHRPIFNARFAIEPGLIIARDILVRATNEQGQPLADGYSAGLRGTLAVKDLSGTIKGVVDHADLAWLNTLMPLPEGRMQGECALTFTADLAPDGIRSVDGYFLPLDAALALSPTFRASGIKGAVKFRLARPEVPALTPEARPAPPR
jgi:hypothetical protein